MLLKQMKAQVELLKKGRDKALRRHANTITSGAEAATALKEKMDNLKAKMVER